ncbi:MAG: c-type cytochrome domain-containing protein [Chitinophagaceae bacterium]
MIVHLPIGFLVMAVLFELISYSKRFEHLHLSVSFILLLGFISATLACIFGYLLSTTGDYEYETLNNHKTSGIVLACTSGLLYLFAKGIFKKYFSVNRWVISVLLVSIFILLFYTGHQGSNLTHGNDYLSLNTLQQGQHKKPSSVEEALLYEDVVQPILIKRCAQCHRGGKRKGQLSMQTIADLLKGGKSRAAVVPGKLEESEMYERITLDATNEKFMPSDGKTPLTKNEISIIKWWIEKGMAADRKKIAEFSNIDEIKSPIALVLGLTAGEEPGITTNNAQEVNPDIPIDFNWAIADTLRQKGLTVRVMSHHPVMLDITLPANSGIKIGLIKQQLNTAAKNIIWLNLSNNGLKENDLDFLPALTNLEKLRIEKNPIADPISHHLASLQHLEALNLNETLITKIGLEKIKQLPNLKRVYTWKTAAE